MKRTRKIEDKMLGEIGGALHHYIIRNLDETIVLGEARIAGQILSIISRYCVIPERGGLSEVPEWVSFNDEIIKHASSIYKVAQQDMLEAGYRKVREIEL